MYSIIAGGGKIGANVARTLIRANHEVTLIEQRLDRYRRLEEEFDFRVHHGDATELHVLEAAGIARPADLAARGHRRRRGQPRHLPAREGEVPASRR